ncbi:DUF2267 domain-containing protein [Pseudonocardia sp. H11422]|uniref:DUF2267 domain-containing protein n=1 Tax=Pseudonocardia sp. H11422 TaxID=2835866 RepID=UPI001BDD7355|nr:DUF2267 domain-containing protein [Pseudonocardia sp. H11422]
MDYERFMTLVQQMTKLDRAAAERATQATLTTLAEHLSKTEAADVMERLPPELQGYLHTDTGPRGFSPEEFVRRMAERGGTDPETAERHAAAVFSVVRMAVGPDEFADVEGQLGKDYAPLLSGRSVLDPIDAFLTRVAERAGITTEEARRITEAVLETLAERIAPGDADDLASYLPLALHPALHRGKIHPHPRMTVQDFAFRVADRAEVPIEEAAREIPAVFTVLREDVGDEFFDVTVQLPEEYRPLMGVARAHHRT